MKTTRALVLLLTLVSLSGSASATDFAVLLGGSDNGKAADGKDKDWIVIEKVSWAPPGDREAAATPLRQKPLMPEPKDAYRPARKTPKPVVLSIQTARIRTDHGDPFVKGRKLGSIHLRDGKNVYILRDAVVVEVLRKGEVEEVILNYTQIENANIPDRARRRMEGDPDRPVVTGRSPNAPAPKEKQPKR